MAAIVSAPLPPAEMREPASHESDSASPNVADKDLAAYVQDERFSQRFEMPLDAGQTEPFVVTYSDFGYRDPINPQNEHVLLFCSPLMGRSVHCICTLLRTSVLTISKPLSACCEGPSCKTASNSHHLPRSTWLWRNDKCRPR